MALSCDVRYAHDEQTSFLQLRLVQNELLALRCIGLLRAYVLSGLRAFRYFALRAYLCRCRCV